MTESKVPIKCPIVYSLSDEKLNFIIKKELNDSTKIGTELNNSILDFNTIKRKLKTGVIQSAHTESKYLEEYFEFKN